nr:hypothetical protein [uncultured Stomatobaculum sp.]
MSKMKMSNEILFFDAIAVIAFLFCIYNLLNLLLIHNKSATTKGTIISYTTAIPGTTAFHNSKWAQVAYKVNGKQYISQKSIQVPFSSEIGSTAQIRYDTQHPERLYSFTPARILISLGITIVSIIVIVARLI